MRDWSMTCLESQELKEPIVVLRRVRVEWSDKCGQMLLRNASSGLSVETSICQSRTFGC
jgi:hypothetical protein